MSEPIPPRREHSVVESFGFALHGLRILARTQKHFRIHLVAMVLVVAAGVWAQLRSTEWLAVVIAIGFVLAAEAANTALEQLADALHPERHPLVGSAKDVASAGVLLAGIMAVCIGAIVFLPKLAGLAPL